MTKILLFILTLNIVGFSLDSCKAKPKPSNCDDYELYVKAADTERKVTITLLNGEKVNAITNAVIDCYVTNIKSQLAGKDSETLSNIKFVENALVMNYTIARERGMDPADASLYALREVHTFVSKNSKLKQIR